MKKATTSLIGAFIVSVLISNYAYSQTMDGTISSNEYGSHTDGQNSYSSDGRTWYMSWDDTNLYVATSSYTNGGDALVLYIDVDDLTPINSGSNSNGTNTGTGYDGVTPDLPFRADFFLFVDSGYNDYKTDNGSGGWGTSTTGSLTTSYSDGNDVLEVQIPWSAITGGSRPSSFNIVGFLSFDGGGGGTFSEIPNENPNGTAPDLVRYFAIDKTASGDKDYPFDHNSYVHIGADESSFGAISVYDFTMNSSGSTITRNSAASNNWTIENDLVVADGTVNFNSTSSTASADNITVSGGTLTLSGSGTTTVNSVTFSSGTLTTNSGVTVSSGGTFYQTGGTLTGNINIERQITGTAGWRLLSIPKTGATPADISDDGIGAQFTTSTDSATMYTYDDTGSFEAISSSSTSLTDGHGIAVYFFNNTTNGSTTLPITLDVSGSEPSSDVVVNLYSGASGRYTLVGNPFASNVDLANVSANVTISSNMTFWDNTAGSYTSENISGGLVIEPWQGYWVQVTSSDAGGQLTYGTADKTSSTADTTHFDKVNPNTLKELSFSLASSYNTEKNLKLQIADDASMDFDNYDLIKLGSLLPQNVSAAFVGKLDGADVLKGIEAIPSGLDKEITLPVVVDLTGESQALTLSWEGLSSLPSDWGVRLHDYETGQNFDLRTIGQYEFDVTVEDVNEKVNPVSVLKNSLGQPMKSKLVNSPRLGITITPESTSVNNEEEGRVESFALSQNYPNPFNPTTTINYSVENAGPVTISIYNLMGQKVAELVNESKAAGSYNVTWNAANAASGMYYYRLEAGGQTMTRKMTLIK